MRRSKITFALYTESFLLAAAASSLVGFSFFIVVHLPPTLGKLPTQRNFELATIQV